MRCVSSIYTFAVFSLLTLSCIGFQDSINLNSPSSGRAAGADDNGTGVVNLLEVFRVLVASGFAPSVPVEFHFYSGTFLWWFLCVNNALSRMNFFSSVFLGEEGGLLGSNAIATSYKSAGKAVRAMVNLDMTG